MDRPTWIVTAIMLALGGCGCDGGSATADARRDGGPPADARLIDARPDGLGAVDNVPGSCSNGNMPRTGCSLLRVSCSGVADRQVEIRVTEPPMGTTRIGTLVLGTGGGGNSYYENTPTARTMMLELSTAGYRLIQRQWIGDSGWIGGPGGFRAVSCRYATLMTYFYDQFHEPTDPFEMEPFCVTGNSGGASEIAYALAQWNRGALIDLALLTGGPPMGRIDHGCLDASDPTWQAECAALVPAGSSSCAPSPVCGYSPGEAMLIDSAYGGTSCATEDAGMRATFLADSANAPGNAFAYPGHTHFLFGADDCTVAVPLGLAFAADVTSSKTVEFEPGVAHQVFGSTAGATAIRDAVLAGCVAPP